MDEIDRKIIALLQEEGRMPLSEIGKRLGMSHVSVRKRLKNLENVLKVSAALDATELGLRLAVVCGEAESPAKLHELIERFSQCPRMVFMAKTTGEYNLMTIMAAEDADTLSSILESCSLRAQPGIRRSEAIVAEAPVIPRHLPIKIFPEKKREIAPCGVNCSRCRRFKHKKCLGCPATKFYRGYL